MPFRPAPSELSARGRRCFASHANVVRDLRCRVNGNDVKCAIKTRWDAQLEIWGAKRKRELFEKVFKRPIVFEIAR